VIHLSRYIVLFNEHFISSFRDVKAVLGAFRAFGGVIPARVLPRAVRQMDVNLPGTHKKRLLIHEIYIFRPYNDQWIP
jgi:hypothetical protein